LPGAANEAARVHHDYWGRGDVAVCGACSAATTYVKKVLNGAKPSNLPVEQPTEIELSISLRTAKALGLVFPDTLIARADRVIE